MSYDHYEKGPIFAMRLNSIDSVLMNDEIKPFWFKNEAQLHIY